MQRLILAALVGTFALAVPAADPPSGSITDDQHSVTYTGGPYLVPNQTGRVDENAPICEDGVPLCDKFELTVNLSDAVRSANEGNFAAGFEITVGWALAQADYDVYLFDAAGTLLAHTYSTANPEVLYPALSELPNGAYTVVIVPFRPLGETFTTTIAVTGLESKSKLETLAGASGVSLLAGLLLLGIRRRRQRP